MTKRHLSIFLLKFVMTTFISFSYSYAETITTGKNTIKFSNENLSISRPNSRWRIQTKALSQETLVKFFYQKTSSNPEIILKKHILKRKQKISTKSLAFKKLISKSFRNSGFRFAKSKHNRNSLLIIGTKDKNMLFLEAFVLRNRFPTNTYYTLEMVTPTNEAEKFQHDFFNVARSITGFAKDISFH